MIPIPESVAAVKLTPEQKWEVKRQAYQNRSRPFKRAPIFYKLLKNPLALDKHGLFLDYMRAFNDLSDVVDYEKPNKYNFKLTGVK